MEVHSEGEQWRCTLKVHSGAVWLRCIMEVHSRGMYVWVMGCCSETILIDGLPVGHFPWNCYFYVKLWPTNSEWTIAHFRMTNFTWMTNLHHDQHIGHHVQVVISHHELLIDDQLSLMTNALIINDQLLILPLFMITTVADKWSFSLCI